MNGITGVTARVAEIQSRFLELQAARPSTGSVAAATTAGVSTTGTATMGTSTMGVGTMGVGTMGVGTAGVDTMGARTVGATAAGSRFATALANAMAATPTAAPTAPTVGTLKAYAVNSKGIPTELAAYGNGKIPASALERVGNTRHALWAPAAQSLTQMIADAKRAGVTIGITDSYRSYTEQVDVARRKGLYSQGGLAAKPGTSEHGWGMAADLDLNAEAQAWMRNNGQRYGFVENTPREPWHWAYKVKH